MFMYALMADPPSKKKLTLSCSRCRASKLKCDRKEPCLECIKRKVGHLCTKDERQPRAKRAKVQHEPKIEQTSRILEQFVDATTPSNNLLDESVSVVAPDLPNRYWVHRHEQKLALIQDVVNSLPEWDVVHALYDVFVTRCQGPLGNVVHTSTFMQQADQLRDCLNVASSSSGVAIMIATTFSMDSLAVFLLALVLGLAFHPNASVLGWTPSPLASRVEELRTTSYGTTWRSLAARCLQGEITLFCGSIASLQAAVMLLLDSQESSLELDAVLSTAISGARKLGLHGLGRCALDASFSSARIRTEIGVRIWWSLVMRDWSRGQALGYYTIRPSQFNTRMPLHINDDDLLVDHVIERPRSEFTMLSYTVSALELASLVRESIDLPAETTEAQAARRHIDQKYETYMVNLPPYFRLGSTVGLPAMAGPMAAVPVHRFMLHQQLWSLLLRLHRLSSPGARASCDLLAQNIISTHAQIQARCTVCGSLSTNDTQLFKAALVLVIGLLFDHPSVDESSSQISRLMTRDKIREAVELLRSKTGSQDTDTSQVSMVLALEALMKLDDESSGHPATNRSKDKRPETVHSRVVGILQTLSSHSAGSVDDSSLPSPADAFPDLGLDLDVMPILSNDLDPNIWPFFDLAGPAGGYGNQFPDTDTCIDTDFLSGDGNTFT